MASLAGRAPTRGTEAQRPRGPNAPGPNAAPANVVDVTSSTLDGGRWDIDHTGDVREVAAVTLERARDHLLGLQDPSGYWIGELETNVTMDAEDVLLRHFLGILTEADLKETAGWIRSQQRDDGTWANFYDGPGDLSTTVEAYVALRLAGHAPDAANLARAGIRGSTLCSALSRALKARDHGSFWSPLGGRPGTAAYSSSTVNGTGLLGLKLATTASATIVCLAQQPQS